MTAKQRGARPPALCLPCLFRVGPSFPSSGLHPALVIYYAGPIAVGLHAGPACDSDFPLDARFLVHPEADTQRGLRRL